MHGAPIAPLVLTGLLALGLPMTGPLERRMYRSDRSTGLKLAAYGATVLLLWTLAGGAVWIDGLSALLRSPAAGVAWLWAPAVTGPLLGAGVAAYGVLGLMPLIQSLRGPRWRRAYAAAVRRNFADIPGLLPNTAAERAGWVVVSLTAGVCEEVLFRGFLIGFLHTGGFGLPLAAALVVSSLIFGLGHVYQGLRGVLATTVGGLVFGLLFLLTGSLLACIVLHVLLDLQLAHVLRPVAGDEAPAAPTFQAGRPKGLIGG
jgi:membrane protease YdiL (CAAX protease family)